MYNLLSNTFYGKAKKIATNRSKGKFLHYSADKMLKRQRKQF